MSSKYINFVCVSCGAINSPDFPVCLEAGMPCDSCDESYVYAHHPEHWAEKPNMPSILGTPFKLSGPPTTQKAKGIYAIQGGIGPVSAIKPLGLMKAGPPPVSIPETVKLPCFGRPCPPSPEHGFVESRVVKTKDEIIKLCEETYAANEASEVIFMPFVEAAWNAIWSPHMLAIGPGHDGATSGKNAISMALGGVNPLDSMLIKTAGVAAGSAPYIEMVYGPRPDYTTMPCWQLTQLRGGPAGKITLDSIPFEVTCAEVLKTNGEDLLEWARITKRLHGRKDVIVWHPGGSAVDHYSVHCRTQDIPIMITREPVIGETYEPTTKQQQFDAESCAFGIAAGDLIQNKTEHANQVALMLLGLHNAAAGRGPGGAFWIGVSASILVKLGLAAMEGEGRHAHACYAGLKNKPDIYGYYNSKTVTYARARLSRITQLLCYGFGDPYAHHSYGGPNWALCGAALAPVFNAMRDVVVLKTHESVVSLIEAVNIAVNQAHNGGWWLNKFATKDYYDQIPKMAFGYLQRAMTTMTKIDRAKAEEYLPKLRKAVEAWPPTAIKPLKWRRVELAVGPGTFALILKAATVPAAKQVQIPLTDTLMQQLSKHIGDIKIEPGKIDLVLEGGQVQNVWQEYPLIPEDRRSAVR